MPSILHPSNVRWTTMLGVALAMAAVAQALPAVAPKADEAPFLTANQAAMSRMMDGMAVKPTGDTDADFAAMMIPHHQGAIDMARAELRWGSNEQLRRIAQEIIVDQGQEIVAMRLALGQPLPPSNVAPTEGEGPVDARGAPRRNSTMQMEHAR